MVRKKFKVSKDPFKDETSISIEDLSKQKSLLNNIDYLFKIKLDKVGWDDDPHKLQFSKKYKETVAHVKNLDLYPLLGNNLVLFFEKILSLSKDVMEPSKWIVPTLSVGSIDMEGYSPMGTLSGIFMESELEFLLDKHPFKKSVLEDYIQENYVENDSPNGQKYFKVTSMPLPYGCILFHSLKSSFCKNITVIPRVEIIRNTCIDLTSPTQPYFFVEKDKCTLSLDIYRTESDKLEKLKNVKKGNVAENRSPTSSQRKKNKFFDNDALNPTLRIKLPNSISSRFERDFFETIQKKSRKFSPQTEKQKILLGEQYRFFVEKIIFDAFSFTKELIHSTDYNLRTSICVGHSNNYGFSPAGTVKKAISEEEFFVVGRLKKEELKRKKITTSAELFENMFKGLNEHFFQENIGRYITLKKARFPEDPDIKELCSFDYFLVNDLPIPHGVTITYRNDSGDWKWNSLEDFVLDYHNDFKSRFYDGKCKKKKIIGKPSFEKGRIKEYSSPLPLSLERCPSY